MANYGPSLRDLQTSVMRAIFEYAEVADLPGPRLGIYADRAWSSFLTSLAATYPVTRRLVGDAYFAQCVRAFRKRHPSTSGDLQAAGAGFAATLRELHRASEFRYLGDIAHFEWLYDEALLAAEHARLDVARLRAVDPGDYGQLRFKLHPSARLFESRFPCSSIWRANLDARDPPSIDLAGGGERLCLQRSDTDVELLTLSPSEWAFLCALRVDAPFSLCAARAGGDACDVTAALQRFVTAGTLVAFEY